MEEDNQEELFPLDHTSINVERLQWESADLERAFAHEWEKRNTDPMCTSINFGMGTLQDLMVRNGTGNFIEYYITPREAKIVATVIQWLGTSVGFAFILTALEQCGMIVQGNKRRKQTEMKEQCNTTRQLLIIKENTCQIQKKF